MINTYQGSYELLADSSTDVTLFDNSTTGLRYVWADFSRDKFLVDVTLGTKQVGIECNGVELIAVGATAANKDGAMRIWGRTEGGPAEYLYDVSMTVGAMRASADNTVDLYVDTFVVAETAHFKAATVKSPTDKLGRMQFDFAGYRYLTAELYDISSPFQIYYRAF